MEKLIRKFLETWHLDIYERKQFKDGIKGEDLVKELINCFNEYGQFPRNLKLSDDFDGYLLFKKDDFFYIHRKAEYSLYRFTTISEEIYISIDTAANEFIKKVFGDNMDGIKIIW